MGDYYGCSKTAVLSHCKKIGYDPNSNKEYKLSQEDKEKIIEQYNLKTSTELAQEYNVSRGMITKVWYDANLKGKETPKKDKGLNDLTGLKVGKLTILEKTSERDASGCVKWKCLCECGNYALISSSRLRIGKAKSCGCLSKESLKIGQGLNFKDLTNQRFGNLVAIKRVEDKILKNGVKRVQWLCKCDCGKKTVVMSANLTKGNTQSCGYCGNNSHGNTKIAELLDTEGLLYEREKRFDSCKDSSYLPFDFYVEDKYLIEFDGRQHFEDTVSSLFDYDLIHKHDLIKSQWCKENNIPLIRIPYFAYNTLSIKDLLLETSQYLEN